MHGMKMIFGTCTFNPLSTGEYAGKKGGKE